MAVEGADAPEAETDPVVQDGGQGVLSAALADVPLKAVTKTSSACNDETNITGRVNTASSLLAYDPERRDFFFIKR